jgi:N-acetylmuramoyl-L-alanine amidase
MAYPFVQARYDYGTRKGPVRAFVIHMAEGAGTVGYLSRDPARGVSVHFVIETTGRIVQMLQESHASGSINPNELRTGDDTVTFGISYVKAALGSWWTDPNSAVLSVEIEGYAKDGPNAKQTTGLQALVADLRRRYPDIALLGHRDFQDYKPCPGRLIPWALIGGHGQAMSNRTVTILPWGGTYTIEAGAKPTAVKLGPGGAVVSKRQWPGATSASEGHYDALVVDDGTTGNPFLRCTDGFFDGFLLSASQVSEHPNPAPDLADLKSRIETAVMKAIEETT